MIEFVLSDITLIIMASNYSCCLSKVSLTPSHPHYASKHHSSYFRSLKLSPSQTLSYGGTQLASFK